MDLFIYGIAAALNFIFILIKFKYATKPEAFTDLLILVLVIVIFAGSTDALKIGIICSFVSSIYLWLNPPKLPPLPKGVKELSEGW